MVKPTTRGRQKITMKKIEDKTHLGVTFTKRRSGLFKKANELICLCGIQIAILMFSPGNKAYSFGHPSVHSIFDRFLGHDRKRSQNMSHGLYVNESNIGSTYHKAKIDALNAQLKEVEREIEVEKNIAKDLKERAKQGNTMAMIPRDQLTYQQMLQLRDMAQELEHKISSAIHQKMTDANLIIPNNNLVIVGGERVMYNNFVQFHESSNNLDLGPNFGTWNF
ncbi:agamous-like MADS-box protein AGL29 [Silene latifolia]|uniref:agamous-like MADS-box protein AGL29 n=1 Tax=Silene latifolia TaxID=37657 RepID=UPI003D76C9F2